MMKDPAFEHRGEFKLFILSLECSVTASDLTQLSARSRINTENSIPYDKIFHASVQERVKSAMVNLVICACIQESIVAYMSHCFKV